MKKTDNCTIDDVQEEVPQKIDGDSDAVEKKTEPGTPNPAGTKEVLPGWLWGRK